MVQKCSIKSGAMVKKRFFLTFFVLLLYLNAIDSIVREEHAMSVIIRDACISDAPRLLEIYDYYVQHTAISFEYTTPTRRNSAGGCGAS